MGKSKKESIQKELENSHFRVAIFGSARTKPKDEEYKQVYKLGKMIGDLGMDIVTGGGPGAMQAANKGHNKGTHNNKKIHSIGLNIRLPHEQKPNKELDISATFQTFSERLDNFMLLSNAVVITPGGVGTLLEFFYTWQLVQTQKICNVPIILMGPMWKGLTKWFDKELLPRKYFSKEDAQQLLFAKDENEAIEMIEKAYQLHKKEGKNACINAKKYKLVEDTTKKEKR